MVCIKIQGGLGNQLFQYAVARSISIRNKTECYIDNISFKWSETRKFKLDEFDLKLIKKRVEQNIFIENDPSKYDNTIFNLKDPYLVGYFQNEKYFKDYEHIIRNDLSMDMLFQLNSSKLKLLDKISTTDSIAIYFRRGDYVTKYKDIYHECDQFYYKKSMNYFGLRYNNPTFFVFSDDIQWVKDNIKFINKVYYVSSPGQYIEEEKTINNNSTDLIDFYLATKCKHHIIANSTYAWWAAWLSSDNNKIVIAPNNWFKDGPYFELPEKWIRF
jgi:hypothetical protein